MSQTRRQSTGTEHRTDLSQTGTESTETESPRQLLFALVTQRLTAAAEDIFLLFEKTIAEYEREVLLLTHNNSQQQRPSSQQNQTTSDVLGVSLSEDTEDAKDRLGDCWSFETQIEQTVFSRDTSVERHAEPLLVKTEPELSVKQEEDLPFIITVTTENEEDKSETKDREQSHRADCGAEETSQRAGVSCSSKSPPRSSCAALKRGHAKNRRYPCPHCTKRFVRNAELQRHVLIHTGQRPFVCSVCGRGFRVVYQLQSHMRTHTGEKTCFCHICNKGFSTKSLLNEHMRIHTGDKPYRCPVCNRGFTQRGNVTAHIRTHTGEKPFRCHLCNRCFTQKSTLDKHVETHRRDNHAAAQSLAYAPF